MKNPMYYSICKFVYNFFFCRKDFLSKMRNREVIKNAVFGAGTLCTISSKKKNYTRMEADSQTSHGRSHDHNRSRERGKSDETPRKRKAGRVEIYLGIGVT